MELVKKIDLAYSNIQQIVLKTPICKSITLGTHNNVFYKMEFLQHTGSFKLRGATNKLMTLSAKKVYTASTGNHGFGVAYASKLLGIEAHVYCPKSVEPSKATGITLLGAKLIDKFDGCLDAELRARQDSDWDSVPYISPYNDVDVMAGQGTIGLEILDQMTVQPDAIFVSVGGGGLIGGIATYVKSKAPDCKIYGVSPVNSPVMHESIKAGKIRMDVHEKDTISDSTMGSLEEDTVTFEYCKNYVDEWILCEESEIKSAWRHLFERDHYLVEGSAALALAGYLKSGIKGKNVVIVLCGRNIGVKKVKSLLE